MAPNTMAVKPAAGPDTLMWDWLKKPTTIPPTTPVIIPANKGAPDANAIPKQRGRATKKTTKPDAKSERRFANRWLFFIYLLMRLNDYAFVKEDSYRCMNKKIRGMDRNALGVSKNSTNSGGEATSPGQ